MERRLELQSLLELLLGTRNVYYQPPESVKMAYPCIVYSRSSGDSQFANDKPYKHQVMYQVILIEKNPDSAMLERLAMLPMSRFIRHYTVDNLNHDVYNIYY